MSKSIYGPVQNWETDFDHADPSYNHNIHEIWNSLREKCPLAHTTRYGGAWLPLNYEMIRAIAYDTEHFSSNAIIVGSDRPTVPRPVGAAPPITSDPPFHTQARRLLLPPFSSKKIALMEEDVRQLCRKLLSQISVNPQDSIFDASNQYARMIPLNVIAKMIGLPQHKNDLLFSFIKNIIEDVNLSPEEMVKNRERLDEFIDTQIDDHRKTPRNDLISYLIQAQINGKPLEEQHIRGTIGLMFIAGVDTTWSMIGSSIWHLATHPEDLKRLRTQPDLIDSAVEEFLRAYAPVTMARLVIEDFEFFGSKLKKDDWMLVPYPAANRDPNVFDYADHFQIDRKINRHTAFGLGIHRCIGSNLARLELKVAIQEFISHFPAFELANPKEVLWSSGQIRGPRKLDIRVLQDSE